MKAEAGQNVRRKKALLRLEEQIKSGVKTEKGSRLTLATTGLDAIPLEEKDIKRINEEISILKQRIKF